MQVKEWITLKRDCEVIEIPSGKTASLFAGTEVMLLQSLGGSYTVATHMGAMVSVQGKDADALGKEPEKIGFQTLDAQEASTEKLVWAQLKTCYDPEIPHNIVDLGLVYGCKVEPLAEDEKKVDIVMTLTAPGCGMGEWLKQDVRNKVLAVPKVKECLVEIVFDPPWDRSRMHPALQRELN